MRKEFIINGKNFNDMKGFYDEIDDVFTFNLGWKIGRNLDAFNDILSGGFGKHEYGEPILIKWLYFKMSEHNLGIETMRNIIEIILDTDNSEHDCLLEKL